MFPHGAGKMLGWCGGGQGFSATMEFFTKQAGVPWILAFLVIIAEFFGSLGLLAGFVTRVSAFGIGCVMTGAILLVHRFNGFYMNWFGTQQGEGYEYHLLALAICIALIIKGGGKASVDGVLAQRLGA
jgi:putative oxidoreductase